MANAVAKKENAVPGLAGLAGGLKRVKNSLPSFGGKQYMSFGKDGNWTLGKRGDARNGTRALLNITSLKSGYVCWTDYPAKDKKKNEKMGEEMKLATLGGVDPSELADLGWEWKQQMLIEGRFLDGDQPEFSYNTSSNGGLEAMDVILDAVTARLESGEDVYLFPIVEMNNDWYDHAQWGKTYKPILEIVAWADVDGAYEGEDEVEEEKPAPKKRKKVTKKPDPVEEPEEEEELDEDDVEEVEGYDLGEEEAEEAEEAEEEEVEEAPVRRRRR
jgi:hypothetical protein